MKNRSWGALATGTTTTDSGLPCLELTGPGGCRPADPDGIPSPGCNLTQGQKEERPPGLVAGLDDPAKVLGEVPRVGHRLNMEGYKMAEKIRELVATFAVYSSFVADKVKSVLNHRITAREGLVALVAGSQLMTMAVSEDSEAGNELQKTGYEDGQAEEESSAITKEQGRIILIRLIPDEEIYLESEDSMYQVSYFAMAHGLSLAGLQDDNPGESYAAFSSRHRDIIKKVTELLDGDRDKIISLSEQSEISNTPSYRYWKVGVIGLKK